MNFDYYEVEFDDGYSECIKAKRMLTVKQANKLLADDCKMFNAKIVNVRAIDEYEAHHFFDMENEDKFPIFE